MKRRFLISLMIIFVCLAAFELVIANWQSIDISLHRLEETTLDLTNAEASGSVWVYTDGTVSVRGKGSLTIDGIGKEARYVTLNTKKYNKIFTFSMDKTDDASSVHRVRTGAYRFIPGGDSSFYVKSDGELHSLKIYFDADSLFALNSVSINKKPGFCFNIARFLLLFAAFGGVAAMIVFKLWQKTFDPEKTVKTGVILTAVLFCTLFTLLSTVKAFGFDKYPYSAPIEEYDAYGQLFDSFMKGRLDLDIPFDREGYESLANPYDYYERREALGGTGSLWDRTYFDGKIYCYFGAAPVLTVYFPIYIISGYVPKPGTAALILTALASAAIVSAFLAMLRHYKLRPPLLLVPTAIVALCGCSLIYVLNAHPSMYYNASLSAILNLALVINFSYRAFDASKPRRRYIYLVLAAVSAVLTVASRPTLLLFAVMTAPLYIGMLFSKKRSGSEKLKNLVSFGVPLALGAAAVMWYNAARFGSPFDFGNNYQLTFSDISYNTLELSKLFPAIYHYFLQAPRVMGTFPFLNINAVNLDIYGGYTYIYGSVGAFSFPSTLGVLGIGSVKRDRAKTFTYLSAVLAAVCVAFFDMCMAGVHIRYLADVSFPLALVSSLVLLELAEMALSLGERAKKHVFFAVFTVLVLSVIVSVTLLFANEANNMYKNMPRLFMFFDKLFG